MTIISRTEDLELLLAVVDSGGFSAAARLLDVHVARVSRAITRLETELCCTLLNRTTRRLDLTEEGRLFVEQARAGLAQLAHAEEQLHALQDAPSGRLRIDAATPFILHQLVPLLGGFQQTYPNIKLELVSNENIIDLIERRTDLAIRIGELDDSNLRARLLGRSLLHIVASPEYLKRRGMPKTPADLAMHDIIGFVDSPELNRWPLHVPRTFKLAIGGSNGETLRQLCLAGHGIALLSSFMVCNDLEHGRLIEILQGAVSTPNPRESIHAVFYRSSSPSRRITAFTDYIAPRLSL